jgi:hypothetical protein
MDAQPLPIGHMAAEQLAIDATMLALDEHAGQNMVAAPVSILRKRSVKPLVSHSSWRLWFQRRVPAALHCVGRQGKRITFGSNVEVTGFSRALGRDGVPTDGTFLAMGLGKAVWKRLAPLARKKPRGVVLDDVSYLSVEERETALMDSMGSSRFLKVADRHRFRTAQVIKQRQEAMDDEKEPPMLMPTSYQIARERALKVSAEASTPSEPDLLLLAKDAMVNFAVAVKAPLSPIVSPKKRKFKQAFTQKKCPFLSAKRLRTGYVLISKVEC